MNPTNLLNDDGTASMATMIMTSHHAFRRDLGRLSRALERGVPEALQTAWQNLTQALHGHHQVEDTGVFPQTLKDHPHLSGALEKLGAQHQQIDPALERGRVAFAGLPATKADAARAVGDLTRLLDEHLDLEEATVIPTLRGAKEFPAPPDEAALEMYAGGFAWSLDGLAPDVVEKIFAMLPPALVARIPAARVKFAAECERLFGAALQPTASRTSIPALRTP